MVFLTVSRSVTIQQINVFHLGVNNCTKILKILESNFLHINLFTNAANDKTTKKFLYFTLPQIYDGPEGSLHTASIYSAYFLHTTASFLNISAHFSKTCAHFSNIAASTHYSEVRGQCASIFCALLKFLLCTSEISTALF